MLPMLPLTSLLFCVSGIATNNETGIPSGVLGASLILCGSIISSLNCSPSIRPNDALFLVIIDTLIV